MTKHISKICLFLLIIATFTTNVSKAQDTISHENFDGGLNTFPTPNGWTTEIIDGSHWSINNGGYEIFKPDSAYSGTHNATIQYWANNVKMMSPILDLSGYKDVTLSFMLAQPYRQYYDREGEEMVFEHGNCVVSYRPYDSKNWIVLKTFVGVISSWTLKTVTLPANTCQVAFFYVPDGEMYGIISIDDITITGKPKEGIINKGIIIPNENIVVDTIKITAETNENVNDTIKITAETNENVNDTIKITAEATENVNDTIKITVEETIIKETTQNDSIIDDIIEFDDGVDTTLDENKILETETTVEEEISMPTVMENQVFYESFDYGTIYPYQSDSEWTEEGIGSDWKPNADAYKGAGCASHNISTKKMVTPSINLENAESANFTFYVKIPKYEWNNPYNLNDKLNIYYSANYESWMKLVQYNEVTNGFVKKTIYLPADALTSNCQISFEIEKATNHEHGGGGVYVDELYVYITKTNEEIVAAPTEEVAIAPVEEVIDNKEVITEIPKEETVKNQKEDLHPSQQTFPITIDPGHGKIFMSTQGHVKPGEIVTALANPFRGYVFLGLSVTNDTDGSSVAVTNNQFVMPCAPVTVKAMYEDAPALDITCVSSGNGILTTDLVVAKEGQDVKITCEALQDWTYIGDLKVVKADDPQTVIKVEDNTFKMPAFPVKVMASFAGGAKYDISTYIIGGTGSCSVSTSPFGAAVTNESVHVTFYAEPEYYLVSWEVIEIGTRTVIPHDEDSFAMPSAGVTIKAKFYHK